MVEKRTDMWVFNELISQGFINASFESRSEDVSVWAEKSDIPAIQNALSNASKRKTGKRGIPEFIIYDRKNDLVIVIENKASTKNHVYDTNLEDRVDQYAVNGALWYAKYLKEEFNVIAVACSGDDALTIRIDTYGWKKNVETFTNLNLHEITSIDNYRALLAPQQDVSPAKNQQQLLNEAQSVNEFMHHEMGIIEHNRLYVVGAILFALEDPIFKTAYSQYNSNKDLADILWSTLERRIKGSNMSDKDLLIDEMRPVILGLKSAEKLAIRDKYSKGTVHKLVSIVDRILYDHYEDSELDLISLFFNVFLSYSTKGGSDLGIVLTPAHITRLFVEIADVNLNSKILDPATGTGGFLTASWRHIALNSSYSLKEKEEFRLNNLYGVESERSVYSLVALNMFLNKDGHSHLEYGDCFAVKDKLKKHNCNVGFINPPYSDATYSEIAFVELMLDCLLPGSVGIAIVPVNAVSSRTKKHSDGDEVKRRIMAKNRLVASIEMPKNLFFPKGTETIVLVFETGKKHTGKTWMAKFDDGYDLIKHQKTRTSSDQSNKLFDDFIKTYRDRAIADYSIEQELVPEDQWVYTLFTDEEYEVQDADLQKSVNDYLAYLFANQYS